MVWFQCEDCGENLKKPKLPNHFRICSAYKLSCIDCGKTFDQLSIQTHTQCISEAEKYGPKDQGKAARIPQAKLDKPKPNADVDVNVGLSSRPPWVCSLCNTRTTSQQTLLLHADGKKHRAKARAFHAAQKQSNQAVEPASYAENTDDKPSLQPAKANGIDKADEFKRDMLEATSGLVTGRKIKNQMKKRKANASGSELDENAEKTACDLSNGEVIQLEQIEDMMNQPKRKKHVKDCVDGTCDRNEASIDKIKWKKLVTSTLKKSTLDGVMKIKKLQKTVIKALRESGITEDELQLRHMLMDKISSSSRFVVDGKKIRLALEANES